MQKQAWTWTTTRFPQPARLVRWGHFGAPVLIFPTAGGDFEEIERFQLVTSLESLIDNGRIKVYSVDGLEARARLANPTTHFSFDRFLYEEALLRIRTDCQNARIEPILAGAALGAGTAIQTLCRHPDSFRAAIGMSGVYNDAFANVAMLDEAQLATLKPRSIILGTGAGDYEKPHESEVLAEVFRARSIKCRFENWGPGRDHTWSTWRDMLPRLVGELL